MESEGTEKVTDQLSRFSVYDRNRWAWSCHFTSANCVACFGFSIKRSLHGSWPGAAVVACCPEADDVIMMCAFVLEIFVFCILVFSSSSRLS